MSNPKLWRCDFQEIIKVMWSCSLGLNHVFLSLSLSSPTLSLFFFFYLSPFLSLFLFSLLSPLFPASLNLQISRTGNIKRTQEDSRCQQSSGRVLCRSRVRHDVHLKQECLTYKKARKRIFSKISLQTRKNETRAYSMSSCTHQSALPNGKVGLSQTWSKQVKRTTTKTNPESPITWHPRSVN